MVYLGEDVEHGGYYLVTEGLRHKYPGRVRDWIPDETSLLGLGLGLAQSGFTPVVEIPYSKYLDCGADMFFEIIIGHWLSNGSKPNGMVIRLQVCLACFIHPAVPISTLSHCITIPRRVLNPHLIPPLSVCRGSIVVFSAAISTPIIISISPRPWTWWSSLTAMTGSEAGGMPAPRPGQGG